MSSHARVRFRTTAAATVFLLLAGCSPSNAPATPSPPAATPTASASPSASPSPTSTLTAAQEQAFTEATDVVMGFSQTVVDLYSGARTRINDLDNYVTGDQLDLERDAVGTGLASGRRAEPKGVQLVLVSAEPVKVNLAKDPPTVVVRACIDATPVTSILPDGSTGTSVREELDYVVVKTTYLPDPGWAIQKITSDKDAGDRAC